MFFNEIPAGDIKITITEDQVNHPSRYQSSNGVECIDAIEAATENLKGREAFDIACAIKYLWRYREKNGAEDLNKAKWYIDDVLSIMKKEESNGE